MDSRAASGELSIQILELCSLEIGQLGREATAVED